MDTDYMELAPVKCGGWCSPKKDVYVTASPVGVSPAGVVYSKIVLCSDCESRSAEMVNQIGASLRGGLK